MDNTQMKADMLALFRMMRAELQQLLEGLTPEQKGERSNLHRWSAKDMLVHLAFWGSHFNRQVTCTLADEKPPMTGDYFEILNDGVFIRHIKTTFEQARADEEAVYQETMRLLEAFDADDLCSNEKYAWLEGRSLLDRALGTEAWHVMAHISDFYRFNKQLDQAMRLQEAYTQKLSVFPVWDANAVYNLACFYAQNDMPDKAVENLRIAFKERPTLLTWAEQDTDLDPLREFGGFQSFFSTGGGQ